MFNELSVARFRSLYFVPEVRGQFTSVKQQYKPSNNNTNDTKNTFFGFTLAANIVYSKENEIA